MQGGARYDLEGNPKGEVTPEQQTAARQQRKAWFDRRAEIRTQREASKYALSTDPATQSAKEENKPEA